MTSEKREPERPPRAKIGDMVTLAGWPKTATAPRRAGTDVTVTEMDHAAYYRLTAARDARYDGRFFIGVKTTGVYCRPICRVRTPKPSSCVFFPSAVAAQAAGFRPCLRCRPETAPALAAWHGTSTTVDRALALIADGALDDGGLEALARRLGVGDRHLRRLFAEHLGVTPVAVAQIRRALFAKRLITESAMSMADVAMAAGFGSVRRFNEAMRSVYHRSPTNLRHTRARQERAEAVTLNLAYTGAYDWNGMAAWLGARAIPGVEAITPDGRYVRAVCVDGSLGTIEVSPPAASPNGNALVAVIRIGAVGKLLSVVDRVKRIFDLAADPEAIEAHLRSDPLLASSIARRPGLRVPGAWDGFELAVRAILGQQISVGAATRLAGRLVEPFGTALPAHLRSGDHDVRAVFPSPAVLAGADVASIGMPKARGEAIRTVARAALSDPTLFEPSHDLSGAVERLRALPGIGEWTAQYIAMRALREPDAFPAADIGLMRALTGADGVRPTERMVFARADAWRPWRAYAALHLWALDGDRTEVGP
ncbi:MAG: transcriptional regulator, AraC family [Candidatus Eremiobacteraeota bacterium]|nr:transcriptional regulator, AraC family [Candidatus Eremiobacteraeota bacterium]